MKHFIMMLVTAIAAINTTNACDMCGGGAGSQYIGLLPAFNRNFAGVQYLRGTFKGSFPSAYQGQPNEQSNNSYNTMQAWGRHKIGRNYQVFAFVPYQYNVEENEGVRSVNSGMGDVTVLFSRVVVSADAGACKHTVFGGAGIKLPTGKHVSVNAADIGSMPGMSPGTGSWDFVGNANYTLQYGNAGANAEASCAITTPSPDKYKYGNRISAGLAVFYTLRAKEVRVIPQAGCRYEYAMQDYYNYERAWLNTSTGGHLLFASAGVQIAFRSYGLRALCLLPVDQHYAAGQVTARYKTETGIFLLF